jgi:hypothetical protein
MDVYSPCVRSFLKSLLALVSSWGLAQVTPYGLWSYPLLSPNCLWRASSEFFPLTFPQKYILNTLLYLSYFLICWFCNLYFLNDFIRILN